MTPQTWTNESPAYYNTSRISAQNGTNIKWLQPDHTCATTVVEPRRRSLVILPYGAMAVMNLFQVTLVLWQARTSRGVLDAAC